MEGEFDLARELYRRGQTLLHELGPSISAMYDVDRLGVRGGNWPGISMPPRPSCGAMKPIWQDLDERFYRSSIAGTLARVLLLAGKLDEADRFARVAEEIADPEDTDPQVLWRSVRSRLVALRGDPDEALRLSDEAVELAAETEDIILKADALVDLSVVLAAAGRTDAAAAALETAIGLYERKGNLISAARIRRELAGAAAGA